MSCHIQLASIAAAIVLIGCSANPSTADRAESTLWSAYCGASPLEALEAQRRFERDILTSAPYTLKHGRAITNVLLVTELRIFALSDYLGRTNDAELHFRQYTNALNAVTKPAKRPLTISQREALLSLEMLERKLDVKWKTNITELVKSPPSTSEVQKYARSLSVLSSDKKKP